MNSTHAETMSTGKSVLRPLVGLMSGLAPEEIEWFVVEEIEKHRRLRDEAIELDVLLHANQTGKSDREAARAYISAMIAVHAQQTVVSTLLDILGYIPATPRRGTC